MSLLGGSLRAEIQLASNQEFYTNGDRLRGFLLVSSSKPFTVRNIEIKLRCDELANVWVPNGQGGYYEVETVRYLSSKRTLFPSQSVINQSDKEARFTINSGEHKFEFEFVLPVGGRFPQTVHIDNSMSGIRWYVKGVIHRGQVLSSTKRIVREFEMRPSLGYVRDDSMHTKTATASMHAYLPGYAAQVKTAAGRLKELFPSNSSFRKKISVSFTVGVPAFGVLQAPSPLAAQVDLTSSDLELILVKRFELVLKSKCVVRVNEGWNSSVHRKAHTLVEMRAINLPIKQALDQIQDTIFNTRLENRLPGSFSNKHFDLSYELVGSILLASHENPGSVEKVRVSLPTVLLHSQVGAHVPVEELYPPEDYDYLPEYCASPPPEFYPIS